MPARKPAEPVYAYTVVRIDDPTEFDTVRSNGTMAAVFSDPLKAVGFMRHSTAHEGVMVSTLNSVGHDQVAAAALAKGETLRFGRYHLSRVEMDGWR